jgi:hypothetical protein
MSFNGWMDNKENVDYTHSGILFSVKKEWDPVLCANMLSEISQEQKDK